MAKGWHGLEEPGDLLDVGNSGTTMRLISGILWETLLPPRSVAMHLSKEAYETYHHTPLHYGCKNHFPDAQ